MGIGSSSIAFENAVFTSWHVKKPWFPTIARTQTKLSPNKIYHMFKAKKETMFYSRLRLKNKLQFLKDSHEKSV